MPSIGFQEIAVILLLALLVFGPKKLPEIGRTLGSAMRELRKAARDFSTSIEQLEAEDDDCESHQAHSHTSIDTHHVDSDDAHAEAEASPAESDDLVSNKKE